MDTVPVAQPRTSPQAVWSLIFGILSLACLWLLGSIPAIILGILAIKNIDASGGALQGRGQAIAGLITGGVGVIFGIVPIAIVAAMMLPVYSKVQEKAESAKQLSDVRQLALACKVYALDNEGNFPPDLEALFPDFLQAEELLTWGDAKTKQRLPYLYRSGLTDTSPPTEPLLLAPIAAGKKRVVGYAGGQVIAESAPLPEEILEKFQKFP